MTQRPVVRATAAEPEPAEVHEVEIRSIAAGGDGVARTDGRVVFVPRTAPGDIALVRTTTVRGGRFARGHVLEIRRPSPDRVEPACAHFTRDRCGGCQLQHLRYEAQLEAKGGIVRDALTRLARRPVGPVSVSESPRQWRYRRKLTIAIRRLSGRRWIGGLHRYDSPDDVFSLEDCLITEERVVAACRQVIEAADRLPDSPALRVAVRTRAAGFSVVVEGGSRWDRHPEFLAGLPEVTDLWWAPDRGLRRRLSAPGRGFLAAAGRRPADADTQTGASFVQINADVASRLHADVVRRVLAYNPRSAIDAYAGTGATALALASRGVRVVAIEADREAAAQCARELPLGSRAQAARVEDALSGALPADVVLLNPPRTGLASQVTAALQAASPAPRAIVYVSCDPATLARDVARLTGWRIAALEAFDMFPQTAHVETVCELVPEDAGRKDRAGEAVRE